MSYRITFKTEQGETGFEFNKAGDMLAFLETAIETVDGFEDSKTKIVIETKWVEALTTREK